MTTEFGHELGMLIASRRGSLGLTQAQLSDEVFGDGGAKERRIRELETGKVANPQVRTYMPICNFLEISDAEIRSIRERVALSKSLDGKEQIDLLLSSHGSLNAIIDDVGAIPRVVVELLAYRFGIGQANELSNTDLIQALTETAKKFNTILNEYRTKDEELQFVRIPFRGRISGGVPIEAISENKKIVEGRFISLYDLAYEHFERGDISMSLALFGTAKKTYGWP